MLLIAGCPASGRSWVVKHWVSYLKRAAAYADIELLIFVVAPDDDEELIKALHEACHSSKVELVMATVDEPKRVDDERVWNMIRFEHMAYLRNTMLKTIRMLEPDLFLSIDSDILINRTLLPTLIDGLAEYDAIGGKVWLHPRDPNIVNYAKLSSFNSLQRTDSIGQFRVDVLMALKLMKPNAYWVDYKATSQGEDIGWSENARKAGLRLGWDGSIASKHIMTPGLLHEVDVRVGW